MLGITKERDWYTTDKSISNWKAIAIVFDKSFQNPEKCANVHYLKLRWASNFYMLETKIALPLFIRRPMRAHLKQERGAYATSALPFCREALHHTAYKHIDHPFPAKWALHLVRGCYPNYPKQVHRMETYFCQKANLNLHTAQLNEGYLWVITVIHSQDCNLGKNKTKV